MGAKSVSREIELRLRMMQRAGLWNGSFNGKESSLQQLAPFVGKLKTGMVHSLIEQFSVEGEWVCDPFAGCGVVPLESLLLGRRAQANDLSPYAVCITRGKVSAPKTLEDAQTRCEEVVKYIDENWEAYDLRCVSPWVREFFHPRTLKETLAAFDYCRVERSWFIAACLCGILHHQRPGFLSYPASHMVPYLRTKLFPKDQYQDLYEYRSVAERLRKKVKRAYRRAHLRGWTADDYVVTQRHARNLAIPDASMDLVLSSPPYYDALDYARDNRLRLWFLGVQDWRQLNAKLTQSNRLYELSMRLCLKEMHRILKDGRFCILVVGEVQRNGATKDTGSILGKLAHEVTSGGLQLVSVVDDQIPDIRRSRRSTKTTRVEKILVLKKRRPMASIAKPSNR